MTAPSTSTPAPESEREGARAEPAGPPDQAPRTGASGRAALDEQRAESDRQDAALMRAFQRGDTRAFEQLLAKHRKAVFNFCLKMLGDRAQAEDALQEVFLRIVRARAEWAHTAKVTTWMYTIARNHCLDGLRRASHRKTASLDQPFHEGEEQGATLGERIPDTEGLAPDRAAESRRLRAKLVAAIASLSEEQREVFVMREYAGMPFKEIAAVVGVSENTVKSRMRYALEKLKAYLAQAGIRGDEV